MATNSSSSEGDSPGPSGDTEKSRREFVILIRWGERAREARAEEGQDMQDLQELVVQVSLTLVMEPISLALCFSN